MKTKVFELSAVDITLYKFVLPLMKELRDNDFDVICGARNLGYLDEIKKENFKTYDIALSRNLNPISLLKSFIQLVKIFKEEEINILHVHTPIASIVGRLAAFFTKVDIKIYTVHGFITEPKVYYYIEKFMAKKFTDYIFTVNKEDLDLAVTNKFISEDRAININSVGIDVDRFNPSKISEADNDKLREDLNISKDERVIGYVGRIVRSKGVLDLVNAYVEIQKTYDCKLLLVGPWDLDERTNEVIINKIRETIKENELENKVLLLGSREDITSLLSIMDIFVLPSYREGMPVSLLEAMSMEKAVIGTNIRGIREEITADSGLIYESKDVNELKKHILYYLNNDEKAKIMGKKARQRVINYFSIDSVLKRQIKVFMEFNHALYKK